jgi:hypothetical protein
MLKMRKDLMFVLFVIFITLIIIAAVGAALATAPMGGLK